MIRKSEQYIGKTFGKLSITQALPNSKYGHPMVEGHCECGQLKHFVLANILKGRTRSCGCKRNIRNRAFVKYQSDKRSDLLKTMTYDKTPPLKQLVKGGSFVFDGGLYEIVPIDL